MGRFSIPLLLAFFAVGSHAFVARPSVVTSAPAAVSRQQPRLFAIDPTHIMDSVSTFLADADSEFIPGTSGDVSYSRASYYTILGLYLTSFPGLWSTIKRSTSAKVKRKTFVT
jgi:hypothetical protein